MQAFFYWSGVLLWTFWILSTTGFFVLQVRSWFTNHVEADVQETTHDTTQLQEDIKEAA